MLPGFFHSEIPAKMQILNKKAMKKPAKA